MTGTATPSRHASDVFRHEALLYAGEDEFLKASVPFIREAVEAGEPVLVVVGRSKIERLRDELGGDAAAVRFGDMVEIGTNPARILPAWRDFVDRHGAGGRRLRGIGEPIWAGRSPAELVECQRHEALLNLAFSGAPAWQLLCPYDTETLDGAVIEEAFRSHPFVLEHDEWRGSPLFAGTGTGDFDAPLPDPEGPVHVLTFGPGDLSALRAFVAGKAGVHGLGPERAADLVVAANEVATNSLHHAGGRGTLHVWSAGATLICELGDDGYISHPLVGRERPAGHQDGGRGLWLANQLCDLVQIRSSEAGTVVRLHMSA